MSQQLGIEAQSAGDIGNVLQQLSSSKYEALVLDFDTAAASPLLDGVRRNRTHYGSVIFALTSNAELRDRVLQEGAHFLLKRPIETAEIRRTLDAAYDFMLGERRQYFRCAAHLPVRLTAHESGKTLECTTINISSNGMAVNSPTSFSLAATVNIDLTLPTKFNLSASGIVIWDDKHGKCGLRLQCKGQQHRQQLDSWLDSQFSKSN